MKKVIFAFLLITLGCATTTYKVKSPKQEYFNITITPLKTTLTVDDDIPVAVNIKNISPHTIVLRRCLDAVFCIRNTENSEHTIYYDHRYCSIAFYTDGPMPNATWNVKLSPVSLCPGAEIIDTISLKKFSTHKPGKYNVTVSLLYSTGRGRRDMRTLKGHSEELVNIVVK